ncbi:MAG: hypothetical protein ACHP84_20455 [Caulobacterales bacterium]|jgi:hypothetical protein
MRRILTTTTIVFLGVAGLSACASTGGRLALFSHHHHAKPVAVAAVVPPPKPPPRPADGLWAILDPGCPQPHDANLRAWPACASPFWISRGRALVLHTAGAPGKPSDASYSADYRIDPGDPVIAEVGSEKDGRLFLALTSMAQDDQGQMISATGVAVACPQAAGGVLSVKPNQNGCDTQPLDDVRKAAAESLHEAPALTKVAWIAAGAP